MGCEPRGGKQGANKRRVSRAKRTGGVDGDAEVGLRYAHSDIVWGQLATDESEYLLTIWRYRRQCVKLVLQVCHSGVA